MSSPSLIFVSYSHQNQEWRDRVVTHFGALDEVLELWDDRRIAVGDAWEHEIDLAIR